MAPPPLAKEVHLSESPPAPLPCSTTTPLTLLAQHGAQPLTRPYEKRTSSIHSLPSRPTATKIPTTTLLHTADSAAPGLSLSDPTSRPRRFRFSNMADTLLLKAVSMTKAHVAPWGSKGLLFEEAHATFLSTAPPGMLGSKDQPSQKSLEDRFKALIGKRRIDNKKSIASSGQVEVYAERETLLDDLTLEIDEHEEEDRAARGKRVEKEKRLAHAGEELRNLALHRTVRAEKGIADVEENSGKRGSSAGSSSRVSPGTGKKIDVVKLRRRVNLDSDEDATDAIVRDLERRRDQDSRRLELEERRYELDKRRVIEEAKRLEVDQELERRRLDVEEKKTDLEIEERNMAILERSKMIDIFGSLADKLK